MTIYALEKNSAGLVTAIASWGNDDTTLPEGFTACTVDDYSSAKAAFMNTLKDQAISAVAGIQATAALTVAMGGTFGPEMRTYVSALQAIADGTDTTSTALPTAPASVSS